MNYELTCPHCHVDTQIYVEVEGPSDYYYDKACPECGEEINQFEKFGKTKDLDMVIMEEVGEHIISSAEYAADCQEDR